MNLIAQNLTIKKIFLYSEFKKKSPNYNITSISLVISNFEVLYPKKNKFYALLK